MNPCDPVCDENFWCNSDEECIPCPVGTTSAAGTEDGAWNPDVCVSSNG
jgi:hypothetical protein